MKSKVSILLLGIACVSALSLYGASHADPAQGPGPNHAFVDKLVVATDRDTPTFPPLLNNGEIYLLDLDGSGEQRLTDNTVFDGFGSLSPDGKKIVFDSNRNRRAGEPDNTSALFLMNADGSDVQLLTRGGSPSWSPDGKYIAFHASASGTGLPISMNPGAATGDSDIFVLNVDDLLENGTPPRNLTNTPNFVDDDPDWSPDGISIAYTRHNANGPLATAEVFRRAADGSGEAIQLTGTSEEEPDEEERAPNWSHHVDPSSGMFRIAYMCHRGSVPFAICAMNADGTGQTKLTSPSGMDANRARAALSPAWSPDDQSIFFHRPTIATPPPGTPPRPCDQRQTNRLWRVAADGSHEEILVASELCKPVFSTLFANVGVLRVKVDK